MVTQTELYKFTEQGSSEVWTYTSGDVDITYLSEDYTVTSISRTDIESRSELSRANLDITVPTNNPAAVRWLSDNGEKIVSLTIYERDTDGDYTTSWKGRLVAVIPSMEDISLKFESIFTSLRRPGLRARYQKSCRHALYSTACGVDPEDFAFVSTILVRVDDRLIVSGADAYPAYYFRGGMLRVSDGTLHYIVEHIGADIYLQRYSQSFFTQEALGLPMAVTLYPGCGYDRATCNGRFSNVLNYGGFDFIPTKNPMGGSSIV